MSILGLVAGIGSSIFGTASAARQARKQSRLLDQREKENQELYDRRYNEDVTQRSEAQAYLNRMRSALAERSRALRGSQAVGGVSDEAVALQKEAQTNAMANYAARLASTVSSRRDKLEEAYQNRKDAIADARMNIAANKAAQTQLAVSGLAQAIGEFDKDNNILGIGK